MTCEPYCERCGGNLRHPANGDWICAKCKLGILATCLEAEAQALTTDHPRATIEAMARAYRAAAVKMRGDDNRLREALIIAVAALGRVNVRCFDREDSPLKPIGDVARTALTETCSLLGDAAYDEIANAAYTPIEQTDRG